MTYTNYCISDTISHFDEWIVGSGVDEAIARLNIESLTAEEINRRVKAKEPIKTGGWWCRGVSWKNGQPMGQMFGQAKPDKPHQPEGEKPRKYLTASGMEPDGVFLRMPDPDYWLKTWKNEKVILITEGAKKAGAGLSLGLPTIGLTGVWNWIAESGSREIAPLLREFVEGKTIKLCFDSDYREKPGCRQAIKEFAIALEKIGCKVQIVTWDAQWKGMDDFIVANGGDAFKERVANALTVKQWEKQFSDSSTTPKKGRGTPSADAIGSQIAEDYRDKLAYNNDVGTWYRYEADNPGTWSPETNEYIEAIVYQILKAKDCDKVPSFVANVVRVLRFELIERRWIERHDLLPFQNGALEIATGKLLPHSPGYKFTWSLPRKHNPLASDWQNISDWLDFVTGGNSHIKNLLIAFCNATLKGRADIQKFLHLIGIGGSGKGTFMRLLVDLVGTENTHTSTLEEWCGNRFEVAQVYKKRLLIFPDEDKGTRSLGKFKQVTGGDWLRAEEKGQKPFKFKFEGMVAVASNFPIFGADGSSGMSRRLIAVPFNAVVSAANRTDLSAKFQPDLAAFTNYLLSLDDGWVERTLRGVLDIPEVNQQFWENKIREDSVAGFLNDWLIADPLAQTAVGNSALSADSSLYAAYHEYCQAQGHKPQAVKNFSPNLIEIAATILGWQVQKVHTKVGKFIRGVRLRQKGADDHIPTYDFELHQRCENHGDGFGDGLVTDLVTGQNPYVEPLSAMVTDQVPIRCEKNEIFDPPLEKNKNVDGGDLEIDPSPTLEPIPTKHPDPSPAAVTKSITNPSPFKIGDRAKISESHPIEERRGVSVIVVGFNEENPDVGFIKLLDGGKDFGCNLQYLIPVARQEFKIGQRVRVVYSSIHPNFEGKTGTVTHDLGSGQYKVQFDRRVTSNFKKFDKFDFDGRHLNHL